MIKVRNAESNDLQALVGLFDRYRVFYEKESDLEAAKNFISERLNLKDSQIFIAQTDEQILVGFVQLYPMFSSTRMQRLWFLNDLFVDEKYRGKGIAKKLIDISKELCKQTNACGLVLETKKSNFIGNQLYPKTGFLLDEDHNYYSWAVQN